MLAVAGTRPELVVTFECGVGRGVGRWRGAPPAAGAERDVELDLVGATFVPSTRPAGLSLENGGTRLVAWVEHVDDDGVACLRLARDGLVLVEAELTAAVLVEAELRPDQLVLTPIGG